MARLVASMEGRSSGDVEKGGLEGGGGGKRPSEDHELAALVTSMHSAVPPPVAEPEPELQVKRRELNVILSLRVSLRGVGGVGRDLCANGCSANLCVRVSKRLMENKRGCKLQG